MDEVFAVTTRPVCRTIQINGKQHYLWRAVDQDGEVVDVYLQAKRDGATAKRFFSGCSCYRFQSIQFEQAQSMRPALP